jgi:hypothetical protein
LGLAEAFAFLAVPIWATTGPAFRQALRVRHFSVRWYFALRRFPAGLPNALSAIADVSIVQKFLFRFWRLGRSFQIVPSLSMT